MKYYCYCCFVLVLLNVYIQDRKIYMRKFQKNNEDPLEYF